MRILFLSSYYPPSNHGWGYMQLCEEVADGLVAKGHQVVVLTSTRRDGPEAPRSYPVYRLLAIEPDWNSGQTAAWQFFVGRRRRERLAVQALQRLVQAFHPDIVFVWDAVGLPRVVLQDVEHRASPVTAYYLANYLPEVQDEYIAYWGSEPIRPIARLLKPVLASVALAQLRREGKPIRLSFQHVVCVSEYLQQRFLAQGLVTDRAIVVHNGVDLNQFQPRPVDDSSVEQLSCLIAGRIVPEKGVHTAVEAFALLTSNSGVASHLHLTILGDGPSHYVQDLRRKVAESGLEDVVRFLPAIPRHKMPEMLRQHSVLILPSEYEEPISRSMQEAMAVGLLVIGTTTGGSAELLVHEQTGLAFDAANAESLARQLERTASNPELAARLAAAGKARVRESFRIDQTISKLESYLQGLLAERE